MPPARDAGAVVFDPRSESWSSEFVRRLASLASASPFGTGWMVERRTDRPGVLVVPGDPVAYEVVAAAASGLPAQLRPAPWEALGRPSDRDRFAVVARRGWGVAGPEGIESPSRGLSSVPSVVPERGFSIDVNPAAGAAQVHWFSTGHGRLAGRLRYWGHDEGRTGAAGPSSLAASAVARLLREGIPVEVRELANTYRRRRAWSSGGLGGFRAGPLERLRAEVAAAVVLAVPRPVMVDDTALGRHVVVVGASGSGKSTWIAGVVAERIERGAPVVAFDLHGDLGPSVSARLSLAGRGRLVAIDASGSPEAIAGVRLLGAGASNEREREAGHLVAALKRLTGESGDVYWGYRLERTFDTFVRLVQEEGGGLRDLYELLVDPRRRDAARLSTRLPAVAAFLDELPALLRRNAEFLAPSAGRVAKVALSPSVLRLLDPAGPGLPVASLLRAGRSIVWRVPFAEVGPETATFAATLLASHVFLGLASRGPSPDGPGVVMVFDEASAISPRLLAEILAEGRKFGVGVLLATQYPGRLAPEARAAAEGAAGTHVVFRVPAPVARFTAEWAGLDRSTEAMLEALPDGVALVVRSGDDGGRGTIVVPRPVTESTEAWEGCVVAATREYAEEAAAESSGPADGTEALLLALAGGPAAAPEWVLRASTMAGPALDPAALAATIAPVLGRGWAAPAEGKYHLTEAGARYLGIGGATGASNESSQHRALLFTAFAIFAKRGVRLEFVRQGRYDRRLPDGVVRQLPGSSGPGSPAELAGQLDRARAGWAWRFFDGRDVDVEAEVSGALRPDRIRRNLEKARARRCFALFLVADPARARRIRAVLRTEGAGRSEAQVWTLTKAGAAPAQSDGAGTGAIRPPDRGSGDRWSISSATA
ncbi:MAG: DUF87 domain-containing protein [Thermoplasmata archaeon]|nr:DUF87 domain-containing protein [Thermoplasmata archaeon]